MLHCLLTLLIATLPHSQDDAQDAPAPNLLGRIGTSIGAKRVASAVFLGERSLESVLADEFALETPMDHLLAPKLEAVVDEENGLVTVTGFGASRTAVYRPGLGCVLVGPRSVEELRAEDEGVPRSRLGLDMETAWPLGDKDARLDAAEGMDRERLDAAVAAALREPDEGPRRRTRAVVVVHRGRIVAERYGPGFGVESRLEGWSMTKSVLNALVGIRVGQGELALDRTALLPRWSADDEDPRREITVDHLLTMSPGLKWSERYTDILADPVLMLFHVPSCVDFAADRPLAREPGERWSYSSGTSNVLAGVLRESFDTTAEYHAFPRRALFDRIGMRSAVIECDPDGNFVGSSYCWATARDWARFGLLFLNDGVAGGERILPEGWVATSISPAPAAGRGQYGRHWWLNRGTDREGTGRPFPGLPPDFYFASGFEDQVVAVVPSRALVIVRLGCTKVGSAFSMAGFLEGVVGAFDER